MMTRLATGDSYTGIADVAKYTVVLVVLPALFFRATKKLVVA